MTEKKRGPGRPPQGGESTPAQKLKKLRSKSWAWACSYYLSDTQGKYVGVGRTANAANIFSPPKSDKGHGYDSGFFSRRRRGKRGVSPETVEKLWKEVKDAYDVGPWVDGNLKLFDIKVSIDSPKGREIKSGLNLVKANSIGGFVPLWSAIAGDVNEILKAWMNIDRATWIYLAPADDEFPSLPNDEYVPEKIKNVAQLYQFANKLVAGQKKIAPLLALTAAITIARITGEESISLFSVEGDSMENHPHENKYLDDDIKESVVKALAKVKITYKDLVDTCRSNGLVIDGGNSYEHDDWVGWDEAKT